jgi:hypothetical protein
MRLRIVLTFDHELPHGGLRSSYKDALFDPTNRLFKLAEKLEVPIVLFTDVLCGIRFEEWDKALFYNPYVSQLQESIVLGHDVQLHLHPHWLTSSFRNDTFIPSEDFKLADFKHNDIYPIDEIIKKGIKFLLQVCKRADSDYQCIAFRAGGYNLERETEEIFTSLYRNGIRFDSSISKGYYFRSSLSEINYMNMPAPPNWLIGLDGELRKQGKNGILEVPIASIPKTPFEMPTRFKLKRLAHQGPPNHGFQIHEGKPPNLASKIKMMFSSRMLSFDNYTLSPVYLMRILDYNVRKYQQNKDVILSISGHPKSMGDYSFSLMDSFVKSVREKYSDVEFTTFTKLAGEMKII